MTLKLPKRIHFYRCLLLLALPAAWWGATHINPNWTHSPGDVIDSYNGVVIHYNGAIAHDDGRN